MSFFKELQRRNVIRVVAAYIVIGWLLLQVADTLTPALHLPEWITSAIALVLILGAIPTLLFSWAYEITPEGLKKDSDVDKSTFDTTQTAKKLDIITLIAVASVVGLVVWQQLSSGPEVANQIPDSFSAAAESYNNGQVEKKQTSNSAAAPFLSETSNNSIAVLPFANRSNLDDDLFFTDGIHDDLLTQLAKISDMKVISRTSVMQYRDTEKAIPEIAKELNVATVLEGGVQRAGKRIRINAQLIDVATDEHLWAETFDREMTIDNLFDIQSEITKHIVAAVKGQLTPEEKNTLEDRPTNSLAAWEAYSKARELIRGYGYSPDTYRAAEPLLQQAVSLDPDFYHAHAKLVQVLGLAYWIGYGQNEQVRKAAETAMLRVESIAPGSAEALTARGHYQYRIERDYAGALEAYLRALKAKPGDSEILRFVGFSQRRLGLYDESVESLLGARDADPGHIGAIATALETLAQLGEYERVRQLLPAARDRFPDEPDLGATEVMVALHADGDTGTARKVHAGVDPNVSLAYARATLALAWMERNADAVVAAWQRPEIQAFAASDTAYVGAKELELGWAFKLNGDEKNSRKWLDMALAVSIDNLDENSRARSLTTLATAMALQGDLTGATNAAREVIRVYPISRDQWEAPSIHLRAWRTLAMAGHRNEALNNIAELLDRPLDEQRWQIYRDPRWDFFRDDERFNKLIQPLNFDESVHAKNKVIK